jgi:hypothetical protein
LTVEPSLKLRIAGIFGDFLVVVFHDNVSLIASAGRDPLGKEVPVENSECPNYCRVKK